MDIFKKLGIGKTTEPKQEKFYISRFGPLHDALMDWVSANDHEINRHLIYGLMMCDKMNSKRTDLARLVKETLDEMEKKNNAPTPTDRPE
jgi:hypothetical protein